MVPSHGTTKVSIPEMNTGILHFHFVPKNYPTHFAYDEENKLWRLPSEKGHNSESKKNIVSDYFITRLKTSRKDVQRFIYFALVCNRGTSHPVSSRYMLALWPNSYQVKGPDCYKEFPPMALLSAAKLLCQI